MPTVSVGILAADSITVVFNGEYRCGDLTLSGEYTFDRAADRDAAVMSVTGLILTPGDVIEAVNPAEASFTIKDVVIGVNFHWERRENQTFRGNLAFGFEHGKMYAIDIVPVEDYLASVISSEMSATASVELLKAHAVISRSWLLAQIAKQQALTDSGETYQTSTVTDDEIVRWYDREDHVAFHVCADDHCQRYQGITRQTTSRVAFAVAATRGMVLTDGGRLCDARFSKCCGGVFEEFENCWEPVRHSYLVARRDSPAAHDFPDLRIETEAVRWIESRPDAFCNTADAEILSQVLNNYDQETADFYRWTVSYGRDELAALVKERSGIDFGEIVDLQSLTRGTSGRIVRLRIVGTKRTMVIGKELEIRRTLSPSHLYSSAFTVERHDIGADGVPARITLHGAGWGHGVGLCQIGAAVMGARGYTFDAILSHYFPGAKLDTIY